MQRKKHFLLMKPIVSLWLLLRKHGLANIDCCQLPMSSITNELNKRDISDRTLAEATKYDNLSEKGEGFSYGSGTTLLK